MTKKTVLCDRCGKDLGNVYGIPWLRIEETKKITVYNKTLLRGDHERNFDLCKRCSMELIFGFLKMEVD